MTAATRIIRKYPNRRLYDTGISSYVTLEDLRQLVLDGENFEVHEARTDKNITPGVLLQVIAEREQRGQPLLSAPLLRRLIHLQGDTLQYIIGLYLEQSLDVFMEQQQDLREQLDELIGKGPRAALDALTELNRVTWNASSDEPPDTTGDDSGHQ
ncbi:MAG TPA: polyhydroxyalkanoate synthesis repressor PhaR [Oleiagrimonas sp.]|nr:polyhydroxyalkanoate synthesis repressor PhaR [Oleiagrimonas sp.]